MESSSLGLAAWKKSTFSNGNGGNNCVQVAFLNDGVAVRDSKNPPGPALIFSSAEWAAFLAGAKEGQFDHVC
jgi:hypothetical protein